MHIKSAASRYNTLWRFNYWTRAIMRRIRIRFPSDSIVGEGGQTDDLCKNLTHVSVKKKTREVSDNQMMRAGQ